MAKRNLNPEPACESWKEVDRALRRMGELDIKIAEIEAEKKRATDEAADRALISGGPLKQKRDDLDRRVKEYVEFNREQLEDIRTKKLNFGSVSIRMNPPEVKPLSKWTIAKVIAKLKTLSRVEFIKVKESLNKQAIHNANLDSKTLSSFGLRIFQKEEIYVEPNTESVVNTEE